MSVLPTDPLYSKLLITTLLPRYSAFKVQIAAIVAMLSVENIFYQVGNNLNENNPADKLKIKAVKKRKRLLVPHSDHLGML